MASGESEKLIEAVADRAREALEEAERQAQEIVAQAESRAEEIILEANTRAKATVALSEDQARDRIERARKALDELGIALGGEEKAGSDPSPAETPEPAEPQGSDPSPEPSVSTDELIAQLKGDDAGEDKPAATSDSAARLVAMNMALEGASRDEVESHLSEEFGDADRDALLDEVFERVGK